MTSAIAWLNYLVFAYFIAAELYLVVLIVVSLVALRRDQFAQSHGRLHDMLTSDTTPPISIVVPAHDEEAGIVESVRSLALLRYPRFEIIVVNDGSTDRTVERLMEEFDMEPIDFPVKMDLPTWPLRHLYRSRLPIPLVLVDKERGGKGDALNAGVNVARSPYVLTTDADVVLDDEALLRAARHLVADRTRTVAVGGNVRPINGCTVRRGKVVGIRLPSSPIEMAQVVEYIRSFLAARPGWSALGALPIVAGAFGVFQRQAVVEVGGFRRGHLGEDLDLTVRLHRYFRRRRRPYRIVYASDAVAWTEVPRSAAVLRRQRVRWQGGLMQVVWEHRGMLFNPRYGRFGLAAWPAFVFFEFLAPTVEVVGWVVVPLSIALGFISWAIALPLVAIAFLLGTGNSLAALFLDERRFAYYRSPRDTALLLTYSLAENLGLRQRLVWWRFRAQFWNPRAREWGQMERRGLSNLEAPEHSPQARRLTA